MYKLHFLPDNQTSNAKRLKTKLGGFIYLNKSTGTEVTSEGSSNVGQIFGNQVLAILQINLVLKSNKNWGTAKLKFSVTIKLDIAEKTSS